MDDGRDRLPTRLEKIAQSLTIAIAAISAGLALYREYQTLRRESSDEELQQKVKNFESQLAKAQAQHLDARTQEQLTQQLIDIRRRVKAQLGKAETANTVDTNLRRGQKALESCGGQFLAPYPDAGISSSHRPPDEFLPYTSSSSRYPPYMERHAYPLHAERRYDLHEDSGRYSPTGGPRYPPNGGGPPPSGYQYGNDGYSRGNQFGTRTYRRSN